MRGRPDKGTNQRSVRVCCRTSCGRRAALSLYPPSASPTRECKAVPWAQAATRGGADPVFTEYEIAQAVGERVAAPLA